MQQDVRQTILDTFAQLRTACEAGQRTLARTWDRIVPEERDRLRRHLVAIAAAAAVTQLTFALGLAAVGPLFLADMVVAWAAWSAGRSAATAAALTAVLVARIAPGATSAVASDPLITLALIAKGLVVAATFASMSERSQEQEHCALALEDDVRRLQAARRRQHHELERLTQSSANTQDALRAEADVARLQLSTLQSVTDPLLNDLDGPTLVSSLLERVRIALDADGVALYHLAGVRGRVLSATGGIRLLETGRRRPSELAHYQTGRTALVHNDAARVINTSLCHWPEEVTSLTAVPVVHAGRLQVVVEVANIRARRSTEWELALVQVVAERAAGLLREDTYAGAVA
jgi:hypothetical protein